MKRITHLLLVSSFILSLPNALAIPSKARQTKIIAAAKKRAQWIILKASKKRNGAYNDFYHFFNHQDIVLYSEYTKQHLCRTDSAFTDNFAIIYLDRPNKIHICTLFYTNVFLGHAETKRAHVLIHEAVHNKLRSLNEYRVEKITNQILAAAGVPVSHRANFYNFKQKYPELYVKPL